MRCKDGRLQFEDGDTLHIDEDGCIETLTARQGRDCGRCEFGGICDRRNRGNIMAGFCTETHFERKRDSTAAKL